MEVKNLEQTGVATEVARLDSESSPVIAEAMRLKSLEIPDASAITASLPRLLQPRAASLFLALSMALSFMIAYNLLIHYTSRTSQRHQFLDALQHIPSDTDCLFLGNSLVEAGCD